MRLRNVALATEISKCIKITITKTEIKIHENNLKMFLKTNRNDKKHIKNY